MRKLSSSSKGFGLAGVLAIIFVVAAASLGGWRVYCHYARTKDVAAVGSGGSFARGGSPASAATVDPYAGWVSYALPGTKLSFKYPSAWTLTDESLPASGIFGMLIRGPGRITVNVGVDSARGSGGDDAGILASEPISTLGGSYFLNYEGLQGENGQVDRAMLSGSPTTKYDSPNAPGDASLSVSAAYDFENNGVMSPMSVADFKSSSGAHVARLIIASLRY